VGFQVSGSLGIRSFAGDANAAFDESSDERVRVVSVMGGRTT
jgi:hypothetical protein